MQFPIEDVRAQFPALAVKQGGQSRVYLDGPGGTQICAPAISRMVAHLEGGTANSGGAFASSVETDAISAAAHAAVADLLGGDPDEIAFGPNMTSLTLAVSRSLAREWAPGDELVVTRLDHDANVAPWLLAARDRGMTVRWLDFDPATGGLDLDGLPQLLGPRTRLVALGAASNALGTLNDVAAAARAVRAGSDALVYVDAVQSVPHVATDVRALGCDFLACSPYKFFGPHQGVLWVDRDVASRLQVYKVRPADSHAARRFETGTPSFEGQAGVLGTIDYLEWLGQRVAPEPGRSRRSTLLIAMESCLAYERVLGERLLAALARVAGLRIWGPPTIEGRIPTFSFTLDGHHPKQVAAHLADRGIFVWSGHFYAVEVVERLGLVDSGGLLRVGLCHYSNTHEIDRLVEALSEL